MDKKFNSFTTIVKTLEENLAKIQYGETAVCLKVHAGRVVSIRYSLTENILKSNLDVDSLKEVKHGKQ